MEPIQDLGKFASLPQELLDEIWTYLLVDGQFTFLKASDQVFINAYPNDLIISIDPYYNSKSWLKIGRNFGPRCKLQNLDDAVAGGFDNFPFEKLNKIRINIEAPDGNDPGQLISLYMKCMDLAELLENAKHGLPNVEINLVDSDLAKWNTEGRPQRSIDLDEHAYSGDHAVVLHAFIGLHNARSINISTPAGHDDAKSLDEIFSDTTVWTDPVYTYFDPDEPWNEEEVQEDSDKMFVKLDVALDTLQGDTADMMRLDRFSSWYTAEPGGESKYERRYERIVKSWEIPYSEQIRLISSLLWRFTALLAFAFGPLPNPTMKISDIIDGWDNDRWYKRYADGIPSFDSYLFMDEMLSSLLWRSLSRQVIYENELAKKLIKWIGEPSVSLSQSGGDTITLLY